MNTISMDDITNVLPGLDITTAIEYGFAAYSQGKAVIPPVGELRFDDPLGDVKIKYGYVVDDDYYVIKIASGFYENARQGISSSNGLMLLFGQSTGELQAILLDEGRLTDVCTAVVGAIAAKHLVPPRIERIGIVGTGIQARLQLEYLAQVTRCRSVLVWGRDAGKTRQYQSDVEKLGFSVQIAERTDELVASCNLIVTTTPATTTILHWDDNPDRELHITAVGSDTPLKQELDPAILGHADLVVADSRAQCVTWGEIHWVLKSDAIGADEIVELGDIVAGKVSGRSNAHKVTVADLTDVAVQDIQIAKAVYEAVLGANTTTDTRLG